MPSTILHHPRRLLLFAALSAADFWLTWRLLQGADGLMYESNPLARWWLSQYGWVGLAIFKAASVLVVAAACLAVARRRPHLAGRVLTVACMVVALVVLYSSSLPAVTIGPGASPEGQRLAHAQDESRRLEQVVAHRTEYCALQDHLQSEVLAQRCSLGDTAPALLATDRGQDPFWQSLLQSMHPGRPLEQCFAANFAETLLASLSETPSLVRELSERLAAEFEECYGAPAPWCLEEILERMELARRPQPPAADETEVEEEPELP